MTEIIEAHSEDIPVIHSLAHQIWPHTFSHILSSQQIAYMLKWMYSPRSLKKQMHEGHHFLLIKAASEFCGYCSYQPQQGIIKLHKIYILPEKQGLGLGKALLQEVERKGSTHHLQKLQLNVNRYNKAIAFYQKHGFTIIQEEDNAIGNGYFMNDYVMEKQLSSPSSDDSSGASPWVQEQP